LAVTASDSVDPVTAGNDLTYTLNVTNNGPSTATGVSLSDAVPAGTSYVSASPSQGTCSVAAGTVTCSLGSLANGASASIALTVHVDPSRTTPLSDTASVSSGVVDPNPANDSDTEPTAVNVAADLSVSKSDASDPAGAGTDLTYAIAAQNSGPSNATGVVASDPVPNGTTLVSADNGGGWPGCGGRRTGAGVSTAWAGAAGAGAVPAAAAGGEYEAHCTIWGGVVECTSVSPLAPGNSVTWHVTLDVDSSYWSGTLGET